MWGFLVDLAMILLCILLAISLLIPGMIREWNQERVNKRYQYRKEHRVEYLLLYPYNERVTFDSFDLIWEDRKQRQDARNRQSMEMYLSMRNIRDRLSI